ncbi:MAG: ABC transporter substrate-binding protein [Saccharofermentans sp.]|nr:ABC transporter substrate-binding protein [Saccharofermentans sp.]
MRKLIAILEVLVLMLFMITGCMDQDPQDDDLIVIGMSQTGAESDWRAANTESMRAVFTEENGYRLIFDDARQQQENQITAIRRFIQEQVDYIVVMPISEYGWEAVLEEAYDAGIPVIIVDRMVDLTNERLMTAHLGADFYAEGECAVSWMEQEFSSNRNLNIVHIQGTLGSSAQIGRTEALLDAVMSNPRWNIINTMDGDFTQAKTYEVMHEYLASCTVLPAIDVVYCENDNEAFGAIRALGEFGYDIGVGGTEVISFDATRQALLYCREGKISLCVECNPLLGPLVESCIIALENGEVVDQYQYVEEGCFVTNDITQELLDSRSY